MKGEASPSVGIIILNWNNYPDSSRCLESLKRLSYPNYQVYLVDNGSIDQSMKELMLDYRGSCFRFIVNGENLGFAAGCNRGIARALEDGCSYVLLLNNDCVIADAHFLTKAVMFAEATTECGIVGGKILFWPETQRIWSTGGFITCLGREKYIGHGEIDRGQYQKIQERSFISGALMLIRRSVFDRIGMLPEVYFFGREDWEFSIRAARAGFKLFYVPDFSVCHEGSHSHTPADPTYIYNATLSKILYKKRQDGRVFFYAWRFLYGVYLKVFLLARYRLQAKRFLAGADPRVIRNAMLAAFRDSFGTVSITRDTLDRFRNNQTLSGSR